MKHWIPILVAAIAFLGILDSLYMTLAHYGLISPSAVEPAGVCPASGEKCTSVLVSPQATIFGIPHALLGVGYFLAILAAAVWRLRTGSWFAPWEMLGLLSAGIAWSIYLTYQLLFEMHSPCPYCLTAHFLNAVILALYASSFRSDASLRPTTSSSPLTIFLRKLAR